MVMVHRAGMSIERITVLPTPSASSTSWARIRQNVSYRPAPRASGERLDEAQLRDAKNLKDAVIATPSPSLSVAGPAPPRLTQIHPLLGPEREERETSTAPPTTREEQGSAPELLHITGLRPRGSSASSSLGEGGGELGSEKERMLTGEGRDRSQQHYLVHLNLWSPVFS